MRIGLLATLLNYKQYFSQYWSQTVNRILNNSVGIFFHSLFFCVLSTSYKQSIWNIFLNELKKYLNVHSVKKKNFHSSINSKTTDSVMHLRYSSYHVPFLPWLCTTEPQRKSYIPRRCVSKIFFKYYYITP